MKNVIYLVYFIYTTKYQQLADSLKVVHARCGKNKLSLLFDMLYCTIVYGTSFIDYFNFRFFEKNKSQRKAYASTGFMYQAHKHLNASGFKAKVDDKVMFSKYFAEFAAPSIELSSDVGFEKLKHWFELHQVHRFAIKDALGTTGSAVSFGEWDKSNEMLIYKGGRYKELADFLQRFTSFKKILIEKFLVQHEALASISPSGLNTVRVITLIENGKSRVIGAVLRISVDCEIDNFSAGNLAAEVDMNTGIVISNGAYKLSGMKDSCEFHPVTQTRIVGFHIPFWEQVIEKALSASRIVPEVRTVGWDMAVTNEGVYIIEGNSSWNKDTWQIPAGYGKKAILSAAL